MTDVSPRPLEARSFATPRLELRPLTRDELEAAASRKPLPQFHPEFPTADAHDVLREAAASGEFFYTESAYAPLACLERSTGQIIGIAGWAAPPIDEALELMAFLVPSRTGQGFGEEALPYLISLGLSDPRVRSIRASLSEDQISLGRFLERHGFQQVDSVGTESEFRCDRGTLR